MDGWCRRWHSRAFLKQVYEVRDFQPSQRNRYYGSGLYSEVVKSSSAVGVFAEWYFWWCILECGIYSHNAGANLKRKVSFFQNAILRLRDWSYLLLLSCWHSCLIIRRAENLAEIENCWYPTIIKKQKPSNQKSQTSKEVRNPKSLNIVLTSTWVCELTKA